MSAFRIITCKVFPVVGLRFCWVNSDLVDVCAKMMTVLLYDQFHQAGACKATTQSHLVHSSSTHSPVLTTLLNTEDVLCHPAN